MTTESHDLVVRFGLDAREEFRAKLKPAMRTQAVATVLLGGFLAVMMVGAPALPMALGEIPVNLRNVLILVGLAVLPALVTIVGVRQLHFTPTLPEIALTVTDHEVVLAPIQRLTLLGRARPERRWNLSVTEAEFVAGTGRLSHDRIKFTFRDGRRKRTEFLGAAPLDTSVEEILAAVNRT